MMAMDIVQSAVKTQWARVWCYLFLAAAAGLVPGVAAASHVSLADRETPVVRAVREAVPAVVNISTEYVQRRSSPFAGDPFFERFFSDFFGEGQETRRSGSLGTGVIVDPEGHVLTNAHVIDNATTITVTLNTGRKLEAKLVGADARTDLAVLKVDSGEELPHIEMGRSNDIMIGETVIAVGNPFGLSHTVTTGVVSAVDRTVRGRDGRIYSEFIQTDASINPGNSGGPLLNIGGELIGISTAIYQSAEGIGFATPIDRARRIMKDLINYGEVHRAWLGLQVQDVDDGLAGYYGLERAEGVLVRRVFEDSPAEEAGLKRGDVIVKIDATHVISRGDFNERIAGFTAKSPMKLTVLTDEGAKDVLITSAEVPEGFGKSLAWEWLGMAVTGNNGDNARKYRLGTEKGVVVTEVLRQSEAYRIGIEPGDVVRRINNVEVADEAEFYENVFAASTLDTVVMVVQRGRTAYHISLNP